MAKESGRKKSPDELRAEIDRSRELVERDLRVLRDELDIPRKIRRSFQRQTGVWITAIVVVGVLVAVQVTRTKKVYVETKHRGKPVAPTKLLEAGFALGLARIAASLLKPMILKFVAGKVRDYATTRKW